MPHTELLFHFYSKKNEQSSERQNSREIGRKSVEGTGASWGQVLMARKRS